MVACSNRSTANQTILSRAGEPTTLRCFINSQNSGRTLDGERSFLFCRVHPSKLLSLRLMTQAAGGTYQLLDRQTNMSLCKWLGPRHRRSWETARCQAGRTAIKSILQSASPSWWPAPRGSQYDHKVLCTYIGWLTASLCITFLQISQMMLIQLVDRNGNPASVVPVLLAQLSTVASERGPKGQEMRREQNGRCLGILYLTQHKRSAVTSKAAKHLSRNDRSRCIQHLHSRLYYTVQGIAIRHIWRRKA